MDFQNAFSRAASGNNGKILVVREAESNTIKQVMVLCPPLWSGVDFKILQGIEESSGL